MNIVDALALRMLADVPVMVARLHNLAPPELPGMPGDDHVHSSAPALERERRPDVTVGLHDTLADPAMPFGMPTTGRVSSVFGMRHHPILGGRRPHRGEDFAAPEGTPVTATAAGRVIFAGSAHGYGHLVAVDHGNGIVTRYAHLHDVVVEVGQAVPRGGVLGTVGQTGNATGPHLHYEVLQSGRFQNPAHYLVQR